jgi:hypothetical protein
MTSAALHVSAEDELFRQRSANSYTEGEQQFSMLVHQRLEELLRGKLNTLPLLRRYHGDPERLGVPRLPAELNTRDLRLPVVEGILTAILHFLHAGRGVVGGPIAQSRLAERLQERQLFSTRFPHILIERVDRYDAPSSEAVETEWIVRRIQNQRQDVRLNRALDAATLGLELLRMAR